LTGSAFAQSAKPVPQATPPKNPCDDPVIQRLDDQTLPKPVQDRLNQVGPEFILQPLGWHKDGWVNSWLPYANMDRYAVTIPADRLPPGFDPAKELATWPLNMNGVPKAGSDNQKVFIEVNDFSKLPAPAKLGDIIEISIGGYPVPKPVPVIITDIATDHFEVTTMTRELGWGVSQIHPVSGSREFGYTRNPDGSITFYTQGLDTPTTALVEWFGGEAQAKGWMALMGGFAERFGYTEAQAAAKVNRESFRNHKLSAKPDCKTKSPIAQNPGTGIGTGSDTGTGTAPGTGNGSSPIPMPGSGGTQPGEKPYWTIKVDGKFQTRVYENAEKALEKYKKFYAGKSVTLHGPFTGDDGK
jgi:hypothetical protein